MPAAWCEIHHVTPDTHGGPTHPDNGVLLCFFHREHEGAPVLVAA
ncbi:HNH endonuclease [Agromyces sp. Soil535]|nr:HNH endonuclease [Agromyces sp. Soil535]